MKRPSYALRLIAALSILTMMLAGTATTAFASPPSGTPQAAVWDGSDPFITGAVESDNSDNAFHDGANEVYFASVANGEDFGLGAASTSITVQNIDVLDAYIFIWVAGEFTDYAYLSAGASKTFSAAELGIGATPVPVIVAGFHTLTEDTAEGVFLAGVAKQAVTGDNLPFTTAADTSVSGYNAVSGREVGFFDQLYFPIVQTNCGPGGCWDTVLRLANVGLDDNAAVTVRFFPADDGSGSLQTGFQLQALVDLDEVWSIVLSDWVPEGWVGSAHVFTDDAVVAIADRYKAGTDMWITNTASNAVSEWDWQDIGLVGGGASNKYALFAADVRMDYNGWNTGINVANTADVSNNVFIQYFGNNGNAPQAHTQMLAPHGMTYFYNPSSPSEDDCDQPADQVPTCDFVGGAIIFSDEPVAVAVDGVKYFGNDANVGQAFTYSASGNLFEIQAAPLVQKGSPATGMGATSGINFMNPTDVSTVVAVDFINPSGFFADNNGESSIVWVPAASTGFVYTMFQHNLPNGFLGSAWVTSDQPIVATTANVDYQVQGDGTVVWNLYNPCGFFRQTGDCEFIVPLEMATKTFDIRPAAADELICVFPSATGQDDKPVAPDEDCVLGTVAVKGANGGGQDDVQTYTGGADAAGDPGVLVTFDPDSNEIDVETTGIEGAAGAELSFFEGGGNATCADPGDTTIDISDGTLAGDEVDAIGDFEDAVIIIYDANGNEIFCDQLTAGTLREETPEEAQERLGTVVPPFSGDSVELAPGCYFFVVSAEGYETYTSIEECLEPGETLNNVIDLTPIVGTETGFLDKTFVDESGNPVPFLIVTAVDVDDEHLALEVGPTDTDGSVFAELPVGDYELCWEDESGLGEGDDAGGLGFPVYIAGCETITIVEDQTLTLVNVLEAFAVLDICVRDEDLDAALPGALVEVFTINGVFLGAAFTDANGEASFFVNADDPFTDFLVNASHPLYEGQATTVFIGSEDPDETCVNGVGGDGQIALNPIGLGAFGTVTKTVLEFFYVGAPNFGAIVRLVEDDGFGGCPAAGSEVLVQIGNTDDNGEVTFTVLAGDYCVQVLDIDGNVVSQDAVAVSANTDTAVTNFLSDATTADIFNAGAVGDPNDFVYLFLATSTDQVGGGSASPSDDPAGAAQLCDGTFIGQFAYDATSGVASFLVAAGAVYCVATDTSDGGFYDVQYLTVPQGDPGFPPDIDLVMAD